MHNTTTQQTNDLYIQCYYLYVQCYYLYVQCYHLYVQCYYLYIQCYYLYIQCYYLYIQCYYFDGLMPQPSNWKIDIFQEMDFLFHKIYGSNYLVVHTSIL
jgi:hypothetical protein